MGKVDLHSHLIPGVDDGVKTMADSLAVIEGLMNRGYDRIFTTPHQVDQWRPSQAVLLPKLAEIQAEISRRNWPVTLGLAAENYLDDEFVRRLRANSLITYGLAGHAVLFECSPMSPPPFLEQVVFEIRTLGIVPVLAHPERYPWMFSGRDRIAPLRQAGCLFQADIGSFAGGYGRDAQKAARKLLKMSAVDFVSSDLHGAVKLGTLVDDGNKALAELVPPAEVQRLTETAPGLIFDRSIQGPWGAPSPSTPPVL